MIIFLKNRVPEMLKKELKQFINKIVKPHLGIHGSSFFQWSLVHNGTKKSCLSVLSAKKYDYVSCFKKGIVHKARFCGLHFSASLTLNTIVKS